jgi:putative transposase
VPTTAEEERIKALGRKVRELRKANEILRLASAFFAQAEARPPLQAVRKFIDQYRHAYGVEPICSIEPSVGSKGESYTTPWPRPSTGFTRLS